MTGDDLRKAQFRDKWRGYDPDVVDPLLEAVADDLDAGRPIADRLRRVRTIPLKFRGYHPADVDALLRKLRSGT